MAVTYVPGKTTATAFCIDIEGVPIGGTVDGWNPPSGKHLNMTALSEEAVTNVSSEWISVH